MLREELPTAAIQLFIYVHDVDPVCVPDRVQYLESRPMRTAERTYHKGNEFGQHVVGSDGAPRSPDLVKQRIGQIVLRLAERRSSPIPKCR
jgi:hypothetical protein